jgi:hypothetical protein
MKTIKSLLVFTVIGVTALISGVVLTASSRIEPTPITGEIEYTIPHVTNGTMQLTHAKKIFSMMPYEVQEKAVLAYQDIISKNSQSFYYGGVLVKHPSESVWSFHYNGMTILVKATQGALTTFFQMGPAI